MNNGSRSDFTNLMENGQISWSAGIEKIYLAIPGEKPTIVELTSEISITPKKGLTFTGIVDVSLITDKEEYDVWYFGHSHQANPYYSLADNKITGSIATQSGRHEDLGYCHIAKTKVSAAKSATDVTLTPLGTGTFENQIAIVSFDLGNATRSGSSGVVSGKAIKGTKYTLVHEGNNFVLKVEEEISPKIQVTGPIEKSYVVLFPNEGGINLSYPKEGKQYTYNSKDEYTIAANKIYELKADDFEINTADLQGPPYSPDVNAIDLGVSVLWADRNFFPSPNDPSLNFSWGSTKVYEDEAEFIPENSYTYGLPMDDISGNAVLYDIVAKRWGDDWRMPTKAEFEELLDTDKFEWVWYGYREGLEQDGNGNPVNDFPYNKAPYEGYYGFEVRNKKAPEEVYIFFPAIEYYGDDVYELLCDESQGYKMGMYWASTPDENDNNNAYALLVIANVGDVSQNQHAMVKTPRYYGLQIRPVLNR